MKKLIVVVLALAALAACNDDKKDDKRTQSNNRDYFCHYYKDKRTDTCFVGTTPEHLDHDHSYLSVVPCSDAVERLVEPWPNPSN